MGSNETANRMANEDAEEMKAKSEALLPSFVFERLLNQDQAGRRISLLGNIACKPAVLVVERAAFSDSSRYLTSLSQTLSRVQNLGVNDIYNWYLAWTRAGTPTVTSDSANGDQNSELESPPDLKINLIYPCTEKHIRKYSAQGVRAVAETPEIYHNYVYPYIKRQHEDLGRLDWVYNILEGKKEVVDVIYRTRPEFNAEEAPIDEDFLMLPDLNWDRKTITNLHILALVARRDLWSLRDLDVTYISWLKDMRKKILFWTLKCYPELEPDLLKFYVHYQPTYYHFHIHVVHVKAEAGATQAVGKAWGLDAIIDQLEVMKRLASPDKLKGLEGCKMSDLTLTYTVGEESDIWKEIFEPLKTRGENAE